MSEDIDAMVSELLEAGCLPTLAASIVARAFVAGVQAAPFRADVSAERRREKDRERKANVRRLPQTSADTSDGKSPPMVSPITPSLTPQEPKPNGLGADAPSDDFVFFKRGKELYGKNAGGLLAKVKRALKNDLPRCLEFLDAAALTENPREFAGRVIAGSPQTLKERSKTEWRNMLDELKLATDGFGNGGQSGSTPLRLLPPIGGE